MFKAAIRINKLTSIAQLRGATLHAERADETMLLASGPVSASKGVLSSCVEPLEWSLIALFWISASGLQELSRLCHKAATTNPRR